MKKSFTAQAALLLCEKHKNEEMELYCKPCVTVANFRIFKIHKFRSYITCHYHYFTLRSLPYVYIALIALFHKLYTLSVHANTFVYGYTFGFTFGFKFST